MPVSLDRIIQKFNDVIDTKTGNNLGTDSSLLQYIVISYDVALLDTNGISLQSPSRTTASGETTLSEIYEDNSFMPIDPNQSITIIMDIQMDETAGNETMNKSFSFVVSPLFIQH